MCTSLSGETTLDSEYDAEEGGRLNFGPTRQASIFLAGVRGERPTVRVEPGRLERQARRAMSQEAFAYVAGGAGAESTVAANRAAFDRWRIVPRMLRDVAERDLSIELFGRRFPTPLLVAPIGVLEMVHAAADLALARGAADANIPVVFSNQASIPMERCAKAMGETPWWFQLYWSKSDELAESFVRRAEAAGASAIVLTLDTTMLAWRPRDLELAYLPFLRGKGIAQYTSDPVFQRLLKEAAGGETADTGRPNIAALRAFVDLTRSYPGRFSANIRSHEPRAAIKMFTEIFSRPSLSWEDMPRLREWTALPILLKGILDPEDAKRAVEAKVDAIVVSNHGGRQVDGSIASLDALPRIADAVDGQIPVLFDGGIRTGADVVKAIALGAKAVLVGRLYAYGLAVAGRRGVREVLQNLTADLDLTLGLSGCASLADVTLELLEPTPK